MVLLKQFRDGKLVKIDRFENYKTAVEFRKKYLESHNEATRKARNIKTKIEKLTPKK